MTWILGLNVPPVGWHDTAACLVDETGKVYAMSEEERFSRTKHGLHQQPIRSVAFCLRQAGISAGDLDAIAIGWDLPRMLEANAMRWGYGAVGQLLAGLGLAEHRQPDVVFVPHHRAHAVCALLASGRTEAAVLVVDGTGEDESISLFEARAGKPLVRRQRWPRSASLGLMYAAVSEALGFGLLGAGKTMGLASYGRVVDSQPWPMLDSELTAPFPSTEDDSYEDVMAGWRKHIGGLLNGHVETDSNLLTGDHRAVRLALSAQCAVEEAMQRLVARARSETGLADVCLAGGVSLNCSANGQLPPPVYSPPVPHDAGVSLGAAWSLCDGRPERPLRPFLGLDMTPAPELAMRRTEPFRVARVVDLLRTGAIGALAVGRAEIGPRALGHRSIIAIPASTAVRDTINLRKGREPWRPLAPVARQQDASEFWTVLPELQRYMLGTAEATAAAHSQIPAAVHVDGTVRAQVVADDQEPLYQVLTGLADAGEPPVLINTSLNTRGEPLVNTPTEAIRAFDTIGLDFMVIGDELVLK